MNPATARKALVVFVSGLTTWAATFLPSIWAGLIGVVSATFLAWLTPNDRQVPAEQPMLRVGHLPPDAGQSTVTVLVVVLVVLIFLRVFGVI